MATSLSKSGLTFSMTHIKSKLETLPKDPLTSDEVTKEEFLAFISKAVDRESSEYNDLYFFLLDCFSDADQDRDGAVNPQEFDRMIEVAADAPRRHGLAPQSSDLYKSDDERLAKRKEYFNTMDVNKDGTISFDEWLKYAFDHYIGKVQTLDES